VTRNDARELFERSNLSFDKLTVEMMRDLRKRIDLAMKSSGLMQETLRMRRCCRLTPRHDGRFYVTLRCRSYYFDDREAVTFNPDGFIGFAGWADDNHLAPILKGFDDWLGAHA